MATPLLKRINKQFRVPLSTLEEYWNRARKIARGRRNPSLVTRIFRNMLSISGTVPPTWWKEMTRVQQIKYKKQHRRSSLKLTTVKTPAVTPKSEPVQDDDEQPEQDAEPELESEQEVPGEESDFNTPKHNLRRKLRMGWMKRRAKARFTLRKHTIGLSHLEKFLSGGTLTDHEYKRAKATAGIAAKLILGAVVGVALFSGLAALALPLAQIYMSERAEGVAASESSDSEGEDFASHLLEDMVNWLAEQDIPTLTKRLEALNATDSSI